MNDKRDINLDQAYAVETPDDNIRLYRDWAESYDSAFVAEKGYVYHLRVAELLVRHSSEINGAVLDVGCGTGIVGVALKNGGIQVVDGIDISPEMIAVSRRKTTETGVAVYRNLIEADLTMPVDIPDNSYAGVISAGTFTHGHLGPESLDELWRVAAPGAVCVIGINAKHYDLMGFGEKMAADVDNRTITSPEFAEVAIYSTASDDTDHGDNSALIVVCKVL